MIGHGGSSAGSYLADPTSPIPSHCASIVATSTVRVNDYECKFVPLAYIFNKPATLLPFAQALFCLLQLVSTAAVMAIH